MNPYDNSDSPPSVEAGQILTIQTLQPMSMGKMLGGIYGALAAVMGGIFAVFGVLAGIAGLVSGSAEPLEAGLAIGGSVFLAVVFPLLYGGMAFLMGLLLAVLYNLAARWFGGIAFTVG